AVVPRQPSDGDGGIGLMRIAEDAADQGRLGGGFGGRGRFPDFRPLAIPHGRRGFSRIVSDHPDRIVGRFSGVKAAVVTLPDGGGGAVVQDGGVSLLAFPLDGVPIGGGPLRGPASGGGPISRRGRLGGAGRGFGPPPSAVQFFATRQAVG